MKDNLLSKFSQYLQYPTKANPASETYPSTDEQLVFGDFLVEELKKLGLSEVVKDEYGYVTACLKGNTEKECPTIGFIAHMDTAPDMPGIATPRVVENYDGNDLLLDEETDTWLKISEFPDLQDCIGETLLTTDGKTLLGADDKAGIAEIMCALEYLIAHPEIEHGTIKVAFTPDEEIGKGVMHFDTPAFGCDYAYTIDGGTVGELQFENFNAAGAKVTIQGRNIHPGYAKDKMVNAQILAMEFHQLLPVHQRPENTIDYEGFFLLVGMEGCVENASLSYIIRDHDKNLFEEKKIMMENIVDFLNKKYQSTRFALTITDQYRNMREIVEPQYHIIERAEKAMLAAEVTPIIVPIRGGTDGANLSFKGLPCPNIFSGGHNFHGKYEYITLESMEKAVKVIVNIAKI